MLAFTDDAALARLMIAATRVPHSRRRSWLKRVARHADGSRQARYRQRRDEGVITVPIRLDPQDTQRRDLRQGHRPRDAGPGTASVGMKG